MTFPVFNCHSGSPRLSRLNTATTCFPTLLSSLPTLIWGKCYRFFHGWGEQNKFFQCSRFITGVVIINYQLLLVPAPTARGEHCQYSQERGDFPDTKLLPPPWEVFCPCLAWTAVTAALAPKEKRGGPFPTFCGTWGTKVHTCFIHPVFGPTDCLHSGQDSAKSSFRGWDSQPQEWDVPCSLPH